MGVVPSVHAQNRQDFSKVEIKETPVAGSIHLLEGSGGNIGVSAGPDGILIVDDEFLPLAEKIDAALGKLSDKPLQYVVNTHIHGDHVGGNPYFGKKAKIIAQANVRTRLAAKTNSVPEELPVITMTMIPRFILTAKKSRSSHSGRDIQMAIRAVYFPAPRFCTWATNM